MIKIITSDNGIELEVCSLGIAVVDHEEQTETWARLSDAQRVELAAALDPGRRGLLVRLDNQAATLATYRRECDEALRKKGEMVDRAVRAERERDAAVARAEQAEKRHTWPKVTPTGHTYVEPRTYEALRHEHDNAAQAAVESWAADECPPEPTWEMVGSAHREVERLQRECDEWKARADNLDKQLAKVMSDYQDLEDEREEIADQFATFRAEIVAEAVTARKSAVTRADIEKAVNACHWWHPSAAEARLVALGKITDAVCKVVGVEAEQDVDPVESRARELYRAATPDARWETVADEYRRIAAHVLEQEAGDE